MISFKPIGRWATPLAMAMIVASTSALAFEPGSTECIAPAGAGGGWDMTCRLVGKTLQDLKLIPGTMQVTNKAGGGGGAAYAEVVNKRNTDNNLLVAASTSTSTRLGQNAYPGNTMDQVRWLASVGADYGMIAVAADAPYKTLPELLAKVKADPTAISFAGGSAVGGWDHLKVLIAARKAGISNVRSVKYVAFDGGGEAVTQLLAGKIQAFTGDISEAKGFVDAGKIKVLAVLAPERLSGDLPSSRLPRSRGWMPLVPIGVASLCPGGMSADAYNFWVKQVGTVYDSAEWKAIMAKNGMAPLNLRGDAFQKYVKESVAEINALSKEIGIVK
jgi:putative tricarboxylic transport membrane protein